MDILLLSMFDLFGNVISSRVAIDKESQRNKGYGFVSYDNVASAAESVLRMDGYMAGSKRLKVSIKKGEEHYVQHLLSDSMRLRQSDRVGHAPYWFSALT